MGGAGSKGKTSFEEKLKRLEQSFLSRYDIKDEGISKNTFISMFFLEDAELSGKIFSMLSGSQALSATAIVNVIKIWLQGSELEKYACLFLVFDPLRKAKISKEAMGEVFSMKFFKSKVNQIEDFFVDEAPKPSSNHEEEFKFTIELMVNQLFHRFQTDSLNLAQFIDWAPTNPLMFIINQRIRCECELALVDCSREEQTEFRNYVATSNAAKVKISLRQYPILVRSVCTAGNTPLHTAANSGDATVTSLLITNGAFVNASDNLGWTPLHCAVNANELRICEILLEAGADPKIRNVEGHAPIAYIVKKSFMNSLSNNSGDGEDSPVYSQVARYFYILGLMTWGFDFNIPKVSHGLLYRALGLPSNVWMVSFLIRNGCGLNDQCKSILDKWNSERKIEVYKEIEAKFPTKKVDPTMKDRIVHSLAKTIDSVGSGRPGGLVRGPKTAPVLSTFGQPIVKDPIDTSLLELMKMTILNLEATRALNFLEARSLDGVEKQLAALKTANRDSSQPLTGMKLDDLASEDFLFSTQRKVVNEGIDLMSNPKREFVKQQYCFEWQKNGSWSPVYYILFTDLLLRVRRIVAEDQNITYHYLSHHPIRKVTVIDLPELPLIEELKDCFQLTHFRLSTHHTSITVKALSSEDKKFWLSKLRPQPKTQNQPSPHLSFPKRISSALRLPGFGSISGGLARNSPNPLTFSSFLYKRSSTLLRWRKYWCTYEAKSMTLYYYPDNHSTIAKGSIVVSSGKDSVQTFKKILSFTVQDANTGLSASFGCESEDMFETWKNAFILSTYTNGSDQCQVAPLSSSGFDEPTLIGIHHDSFAPERDCVNAKWYVDAHTYFEDLATLLEEAKDDIFIADWSLNPEIYLRRGPTATLNDRLDKVLQRKAQQGVKIFVIVWWESDFLAGTVNAAHAKSSLQALCPSHIRVQRHPRGKTELLYSHHQKIVVIDRCVAFVGGVDLCFGRYDDQNHLLFEPCSQQHTQFPGKDYYNPQLKDFCFLENPWSDQIDRTKDPRMPWHDIHCVVDGNAAADIAQNFIQRWNHHRGSSHLQETGPCTLHRIPGKRKVFSGTAQVQALRSVGFWSIGQQSSRLKEQSIYNCYMNLIKNAKHYIYIENQFFVSSQERDGIENKIADAIVNRIIEAHRQDEVFRVFVVLPEHPAGPLDSGNTIGVMKWQYQTICRGKGSVLERLKEAIGEEASNYITFNSLRTYGVQKDRIVSEMVYVHSKLMIVDDLVAIIGSANINERSMAGDRDSEIAVLIKDTEHVESIMNASHFKASRFAYELRTTLWKEHLGLADDLTSIVKDPISEATFFWWKQVAVKNTAQYKELEGASSSSSSASGLSSSAGANIGSSSVGLGSGHHGGFLNGPAVSHSSPSLLITTGASPPALQQASSSSGHLISGPMREQQINEWRRKVRGFLVQLPMDHKMSFDIGVILSLAPPAVFK